MTPESSHELRTMTQIHAELEELAPDARVRALAWLLVALRVDVVDVYQEAKRLGLTGQHGLVRGLPADEATG